MHILPLAAKCSTCVVGKFCLPVGLSSDETKKIDLLIDDKTRIKKGELLYRQSDPMISLYSVRFGSFKTQLLLKDGRSQIIGFHLPGELLGLDGIGNDRYQSEAIALEDSEVCMIHFSSFESLCQKIPTLQHHLHQIMSREITQDHRHLLTLGSMNAEEKLAYFFIFISERLISRGLSATEFDLAMGREDIGDYLGLKIETVSRILTKFAQENLIEVKSKHLKLLNLGELYRLAGSELTQLSEGFSKN
jgi:CRP/FNR family transcriptional regulator